MFMTADLGGDGRCNIQPNYEFMVSRGLRHYTHHTKAIPLRVVRKIIQIFLSRGYSVHSEQMATVWVVQEYCELNNLSYYIKRIFFDGVSAGVYVVLDTKN